MSFDAPFSDPKKIGRERRGKPSERAGKGKKNVRKKRSNYNNGEPNPRKALIDEFKDTKNYLKYEITPRFIGTKFHEKTFKLTFNEIDTVFSDLKKEDLTFNSNVMVSVVNQDTLIGVKETIAYLKEKFGIVDPKALGVINASEYRPGGGVGSGSRAQEEEIYRRTSSWLYLNSKNGKEYYPLKEDEMIQTMDVITIKDTDYRKLTEEEEFSADFLTIAAIRNPATAIDSNGIQRFSNTKQRSLTEKKIESIFKMAIADGYDALILGALGCGAFKNPPHDVITIFKRCLKKYGKHFKYIRFSILSRGENKNYDIFTCLKQIIK